MPTFTIDQWLAMDDWLQTILWITVAIAVVRLLLAGARKLSAADPTVRRIAPWRCAACPFTSPIWSRCIEHSAATGHETFRQKATP